jgi:hypothetical protein
MANKQSPMKGEILAIIVLILVSGSLSLALIDKDSRSAFADLAKVGVGGYIGLLIPRKKSS